MTPQRVIEAGANVATTTEGRSRIEAIKLCAAGYAGPGYVAPAGVVAFGNWNTVTRWNARTGSFSVEDETPKRVGDLLEKLGIELEWSDEWATCDNCGKAVRVKPGGCGWKAASWQDDDGELHCHKCVRSDPTTYLASVEGNHRSCITFDLDLGRHGYPVRDCKGDRFYSGAAGSEFGVGLDMALWGLLWGLLRRNRAPTVPVSPAAGPKMRFMLAVEGV
jgi:hypothetical protein